MLRSRPQSVSGRNAAQPGVTRLHNAPRLEVCHLAPSLSWACRQKTAVYLRSQCHQQVFQHRCPTRLAAAVTQLTTDQHSAYDVFQAVVDRASDVRSSLEQCKLLCQACHKNDSSLQLDAAEAQTALSLLQKCMDSYGCVLDAAEGLANLTTDPDEKEFLRRVAASLHAEYHQLLQEEGVLVLLRATMQSLSTQQGGKDGQEFAQWLMRHACTEAYHPWDDRAYSVLLSRQDKLDRWHTLKEEQREVLGYVEMRLLSHRHSPVVEISDLEMSQDLTLARLALAQGWRPRSGAPTFDLRLNVSACTFLLDYHPDLRLRQQVFDLGVSQRATEVVEAFAELARLRHKMARMYGVPDFSHVCHQNTWLGGGGAAVAFLSDLLRALRPAADTLATALLTTQTTATAAPPPPLQRAAATPATEEQRGARPRTQPTPVHLDPASVSYLLRQSCDARVAPSIIPPRPQLQHLIAGVSKLLRDVMGVWLEPVHSSELVLAVVEGPANRSLHAQVHSGLAHAVVHGQLIQSSERESDSASAAAGSGLVLDEWDVSSSGGSGDMTATERRLPVDSAGCLPPKEDPPQGPTPPHAPTATEDPTSAHDPTGTDDPTPQQEPAPVTSQQLHHRVRSHRRVDSNRREQHSGIQSGGGFQEPSQQQRGQQGPGTGSGVGDLWVYRLHHEERGVVGTVVFKPGADSSVQYVLREGWLESVGEAVGMVGTGPVVLLGVEPGLAACPQGEVAWVLSMLCHELGHVIHTLLSWPESLAAPMSDMQHRPSSQDGPDLGDGPGDAGKVGQDRVVRMVSHYKTVMQLPIEVQELPSTLLEMLAMQPAAVERVLQGALQAQAAEQGRPLPPGRVGLGEDRAAEAEGVRRWAEAVAVHAQSTLCNPIDLQFQAVLNTLDQLLLSQDVAETCRPSEAPPAAQLWKQLCAKWLPRQLPPVMSAHTLMAVHRTLQLEGRGYAYLFAHVVAAALWDHRGLFKDPCCPQAWRALREGVYERQGHDGFMGAWPEQLVEVVEGWKEGKMSCGSSASHSVLGSMLTACYHAPQTHV